MKNKPETDALDRRAVDRWLDEEDIRLRTTMGPDQDAKSATTSDAMRRVESTVAALRSVPSVVLERDLSKEVCAAVEEEDARRRGVVVRWWGWASSGAVAAALLVAFLLLAGGQQAESPHVVTRSGVEAGPAVLDERAEAQHWLLQAQEGDGSWNAARWGGHPQYDIALTALSILALLEGEGAHEERGLAVRRAAHFLLAQQNRDGSFGEAAGRPGYNLGIATVALLAAFELHKEDDWEAGISVALQRMVKNRTQAGGWSYGFQVARSSPSLSVAYWQWEALALARRLGWEEVEPLSDATMLAQAAGSVGPQAEEAWMRAGGRLYATAMACIRL